MLTLTFLQDATFKDLWRCECSLSSRPPNSDVECFCSVVWIFMLLNFTCKSIFICSSVHASGAGCVYVYGGGWDVWKPGDHYACGVRQFCWDINIHRDGRRESSIAPWTLVAVMNPSRMARAQYKQSKIIVVNGRTTVSLYMLIGGDSCSLKLL